MILFFSMVGKELYETYHFQLKIMLKVTSWKAGRSGI